MADLSLARHARSASAPSLGALGMWVFLATDAMGFGALLVAHRVLRATSQRWPETLSRSGGGVPVWLSLVLLASGACATLAAAAGRRGRPGRARGLGAVAGLLGLGFLALQAVEYRHLLGGHVGLARDLGASTFYAVTGYHGLHVLVGAALLLGVALRGGGADGAAGLPVVVLYWQFVDLAWAAILAVVYLAPGTDSPAAWPLAGLALVQAAAAGVGMLGGRRAGRGLVAWGLGLLVFLVVLGVVLALDAAFRMGVRP